jgi:hypothetical protein
MRELSMYLRVHESEGSRVVAVCDKELIGTVLDDGKAYMDLDKHRSFYVGERAAEDEVKQALNEFSSANIVGEKAVGVALSLELAVKDDIMYINETPYIQIYKI